jgi:hypothetical protein
MSTPVAIDCPECAYELRTGQPVPDGIVHQCDEPAEVEEEDEPEPDGRWCFSTEAGCWVYE